VSEATYKGPPVGKIAIAVLASAIALSVWIAIR
jgi:hypothetical protein